MRNDKPKAPSVEQLSPDRSVETQAKDAQAKIDALALKPDVRIQTIQHPQGPRTLAKGKDGKFVRKIRALTEVSTSMVAEVLLHVDEATQKTVHQLMVENLANLCKNATSDKAILGAVKALERLETSAGITQQRENLLRDEDKGPQHLTVVFGGQETILIMQRQMDALMAYVRTLESRLGIPVEQAFRDSSKPDDVAPTKSQPSWIRPNPPIAEIVGLRTNPK